MKSYSAKADLKSMEDWEKKAYLFARQAHKDQKDDEGKDFFEAHIIPVANIVKQVSVNKTVITAAYLHDTLEDTDCRYKDIVENFGEEIAMLVNELTHEWGGEKVGYLFPRLKTREAIMVKLADRLSNVSRMNSWSKERVSRYLKNTRFWHSKPGD